MKYGDDVNSSPGVIHKVLLRYFCFAELGDSVDTLDKSLTALIESLDSGEEILYWVRATLVNNPKSQDERGVLAVTTKRVLFKEHSFYGTPTSLQWPWDWLKGVSSRKALSFEHIRIKSPGGTEKFLVNYGEADSFITSVYAVIENQA